MIDSLNYYQTEMKYSVQPQTLLEVALMKLCSVSAVDSGVAAALESTGAVQATGESAPRDRASDGLVTQLTSRIQRLEEQLAQLLKQGLERPQPVRTAAVALRELACVLPPIPRP